MIIRKLEALISFRFDTSQLDKANGDINKFAKSANNAMTALCRLLRNYDYSASVQNNSFFGRKRKPRSEF